MLRLTFRRRLQPTVWDIVKQRLLRIHQPALRPHGRILDPHRVRRRIRLPHRCTPAEEADTAVVEQLPTAVPLRAEVVVAVAVAAVAAATPAEADHRDSAVVFALRPPWTSSRGNNCPLAETIGTDPIQSIRGHQIPQDCI